MKNNNKILDAYKNVISVIFNIMPLGKVVNSISGYVDL